MAQLRHEQSATGTSACGPKTALEHLCLRSPALAISKNAMRNFAAMCGRSYVKSTFAEMVSHFSFSDPADVGALDNTFPRYNGAPTQDYPIIIVDELAQGSTCSSRAAGVSSQKPEGW